MKRGRGRISLYIGILLIAAVLLVLGYLYLTRGLSFTGDEGEQPSLIIQPTPVPMVRVVFALQDVPAQTILTPDLIATAFETRDIPRDEVRGESVINSTAQLEGKYVLTTLRAETTVREDQLNNVTLSLIIPEGKRAFPLEVDHFSGIVGRISPNDYVDVIFSGDIEQRFPQPFPFTTEEFGEFSIPSPVTLLSVKTILQDIQVLEVISLTADVEPQPGEQAPPEGEEGEPQAPPPPIGWILILAVDDQQGEVLKFSQDQGMAVQLLLRPQGDHDVDTTSGITTFILVDRYGLPLPKLLPYEISPGVLPRGVIP